MPFELRHGNYLISDAPARIDVDAVHRYLAADSYWAKGIPRDVVATAIAHSLCIGVYTAAGEQVGLTRVVTDFATFAWVCDVFVLEAHRGHGLGKVMVQATVTHPRLQTIRRFALATRDAHALYAQFGFKPLAAPETQMERRDPDIYNKLAAAASRTSCS